MEISVPKQTTTYTFDDGRSHEISLIAAVEAATEILNRRAKEVGFGYVDDFKAWWEKNATVNSGAGTITRDEAGWLCDMVFVEAAQQKKSRADLAPSWTSTDSSPPA